MKFRIAKPEDLPAIQKLLRENFYLNEPMTKCLGLYRENSAKVDALIKKHNLSLIAVDPDTNALVGAMLNGEYHTSEIDVPMEEERSFLKNITSSFSIF